MYQYVHPNNLPSMILLSLLLDTRRLIAVRVTGLSVIRSRLITLSVIRSRLLGSRLLRPRLIGSRLVRSRVVRSRVVRSRVIRPRVTGLRVIRSRILVTLRCKFPLFSCVLASIDISKGIFQRKSPLVEIVNVHRLCKTVILDSIDRRSIHHDNIYRL